MKKNLRIVSAAAAALLAVAPVAASAVSTVNADVTVNGDTTKPVATAGTVTINASVTASAGKTKPQAAAESVKLSFAGATLNGNYDKTKASIVNEDGSAATTDSNGNLVAGKLYRIEYQNLQLNGLTTGSSYKIAGGKVVAHPSTGSSSYANAKDTASAETLKSGVDFYSDTFTLTDSNLAGTPIVRKVVPVVGSTPAPLGDYVSKGEVDLGNNTNVTALAQDIANHYQAALEGLNSKGQNNAVFVDTTYGNFDDAKAAVKKALANNNITLDGENFNTPAANFVVNLTATASNGKKVEFPVTVKVATKKDSPKFTLNNGVSTDDHKYEEAGTNTWNLTIPVNAAVSAKSIASEFTAATYEGSGVNTTVNVDSSNLNTSVAGKYTVVLSATNNANKTTKATINVTVGNPGETKTVQAGSDTAKIVTIDGNKVTETNDTLANGSQVATYGTTTVNGVSYTKLNSTDSNKYVETKYVDGSIKAVDEKSESTMIMYKSAIYDKDGKKTNKDAIAGYTNKDLVVDENGDLHTYTINGESFYKIANEDSYVRARNVTGSKMTLKHNAYVYKSNGKRANKKVLKKGSTITVYGGQYKAMKGYKKNMARIGVNQYVKVANIKSFDLAK